MRRIVVGLAVVAAACAAAVVAFLAVAARLLRVNALLFSGTDQPSERQIEESQRIGHIANALEIACGPLAAAALIAVVAILVLLAFRWELRRAARSA